MIFTARSTSVAGIASLCYNSLCNKLLPMLDVMNDDPDIYH